jgi:hypothetical protein
MCLQCRVSYFAAAERTPEEEKRFKESRKQHYNMAEQLRRARELLAQEDDEDED